ncbi:MAG: pyridoxamine 5'-phosphate oxidase family protein [Ilumatobacter sp.]|uniref:pyridoxamine 5'-phosphate oxidase family protein n=1 Tax=Ilumatobacter sp. TaxID=1967498 RepID=UPI002634DF20|nr:pyridoxamine 5'-phosphate oxidase family protein [Ilumatobacter sp.]MDJ0768388.1 pyridoxamine 5'-phosphate oxidase family protein [Ilumatobacter sp.]
MPKLTGDELEAFLDERGHLARIGTVDEDGFPRVLPLWFIRDGQRLLFTPREPAVIWRNIQADARIGLSIDEAEQPYRKVTVQGECIVVHPPGEDDQWRDLYRAITRRYTSERFADLYVDGTDDQPRALCAIDLDAPTTRVSTWRMPLPGEDQRGVWAKRYYRPGTKWSDS